jgi:hypothetical protein
MLSYCETISYNSSPDGTGGAISLSTLPTKGPFLFFFLEFFGHLDLVLKVSSTVEHLLVLTTHICRGDLMRSY